VILRYRAGRQGEDKQVVGGTAEWIREEKKRGEKLKKKEKKNY